ncbi:MAG: hypothetical protein AAGF12_36765 [Myxococcota bacterium]
MNIDIRALITEINTLAKESKALKRELRKPWTEPMADTQQKLVACRRRTTRLCILRAWLRGKFHLQRPLREGAYPGMEWHQERYHRLVAAQVAGEFPAGSMKEPTHDLAS